MVTMLKMRRILWPDRPVRAGVLLIALSPLLLLLTLACGDAGGGPTGGGRTGSTSVFLTDAASDQFDEILVTITSIELVGNGAPVMIFSGRETVDLKDLENFSDLFVYAEEVPVGTYNKIRMRVSKIELVEDDAVTEVDPPSQGKIDLVPRNPFDVREGINLVIEIDMDAKKSVQHGDGYRFRPVIFVTIRDTRSPDKLARVHGEITELLADRDFELCSTVFMAARTNSSEEGIHEGGLGDRNRCMTVELDGDTGVFNSNGDPADASTLRVGDVATLVGRFHLIDDNHDRLIPRLGAAAGWVSSDGYRDPTRTGHREHYQSFHEALSPSSTAPNRDEDPGRHSDDGSDGGDRPPKPRLDIIFLAYVVEVGPPGTFLHLKGVIETPLENVEEFDFAVAPGQGFGDASIATALLQDGTRIFNKRGEEIGESEIIPDTGAKIDGVFATDAIGTFYKTALLILDLEASSESVLRGEILQANETTGRLRLEVDGRNECIDVPQTAGIFLIRNTDSGATSEEGRFEDLTPGLRSDVYGAFPQNGDCFVAETVLAFPTECLDNIECPASQYCAKGAGACEEPGRCEAIPEGACLTVFDPVCGCDDVTYSNECVARTSGASIARPEAC